jgi:hypothetical protein
MRAKKSFYSSFLVQPILNGVGGFFIFLVILILTKLIAYWLGTQATFSVVFEDVILSSVGFLLFFLIKFLENFRSKHVQ